MNNMKKANDMMTYRIVKIDQNVSRNTFDLHIEQIETQQIRVMYDVRIWENDNDSLHDMFYYDE